MNSLDLRDECVGIKPRKNKRSNRYKRPSISLPRILLKGLLRKIGLRADNVYFRDPERFLYGGWATGRRLRGLAGLLSVAHGCSVLDLGCAEGMIAEAFLRSGARLVHGFDVNPRRIAKAQRLVLDTRACFRTGDITKWKRFIKIGHLHNEYDIVLFLSIYRQLKENRMEILRNVIARTGWLLAIRGAQPDIQEAFDVALSAGMQFVAQYPKNLQVFTWPSYASTDIVHLKHRSETGLLTHVVRRTCEEPYARSTSS